MTATEARRSILCPPATTKTDNLTNSILYAHYQPGN